MSSTATRGTQTTATGQTAASLRSSCTRGLQPAPNSCKLQDRVSSTAAAAYQLSSRRQALPFSAEQRSASTHRVQPGTDNDPQVISNMDLGVQT